MFYFFANCKVIALNLLCFILCIIKQIMNIVIKRFSKEVKTDNFCYRKVGRAKTKWGAIVNIQIGATYDIFAD